METDGAQISEELISDTASPGSDAVASLAKKLSKAARKRRNRQLNKQNALEMNLTNKSVVSNQSINLDAPAKRKYTAEEKNLRRKLFIEKNEEKNIIHGLKRVRGPTVALPEVELTQKKFSSDCRLYVGNIPKQFSVENLQVLFSPFGELSDIFINTTIDKPYALLRMDFLENAEKARRHLTRSVYQNKKLFVHMSRMPSSIRVKNLNSTVTNELLKRAFEVFGEVEKALVHMENDESTSEGIVQFSNHSSAQLAVRYCEEECFFLTSSLQPVICEIFDGLKDKVGFSEKDIDQKTPFYLQERSNGPRFAENRSQHECGMQYKQLFAAYEYKKKQLNDEFLATLYTLHRETRLAQYDQELEDLRRQINKRKSKHQQQQPQKQQQQHQQIQQLSQAMKMVRF